MTETVGMESDWSEPAESESAVVDLSVTESARWRVEPQANRRVPDGQKPADAKSDDGRTGE